MNRRALAALLIGVLSLSACVPQPAEPATPDQLSPTAQTDWWVPAQGASWHIQYRGELVIPPDVAVVDLDGNETPASVVAELNESRKHAICYLNAGAVEDWRPDADQFPSSVVGEPMADWQGERWLDIRQLDVLLPIMAARMDECAAKGFAGVDPDNVHGFELATGFPLTSGDAVRYVTALAELAHDRGLAIGLKNALPIIEQTVDVVDFAVNEECVAYQECAAYQPFLDVGKAVFHIEYAGSLASVCPARPAQFSTVIKNSELDAQTASCL